MQRIRVNWRPYRSTVVLKACSTRSMTVRMASSATLSTTNSSQNVTLPVIPELYDPNFLDRLIPPTDGRMPVRVVAPTINNPMMDALQSTANHAFTENDAPTYTSTLSATLDAFQGISNYSYRTEVDKYLSKAWEEDPELTIRIIWNLRSIHDGKAEKEAFYRAFGWLYENHPRTAISNLHLLVEPVCTSPKEREALPHGYWKDLLNILALATLDELSSLNEPSTFLHAPKMKRTHTRKIKKTGDAAARIEASRQLAEQQKVVAKQARAVAAAQSHERLVGKLAQLKYRALYIAVSRLFSERLLQDLRVLKDLYAIPAGEDRFALLKQISLAAKWAPTPRGAHDRHTNISTAITSLLHNSAATIPFPFPSALNDALEPSVSCAILRSFYQRWVLKPLREVSQIPEPLMGSNRWTEIAYNRVSSVCMKNNKGHFCKHDPEGFEKYLISVESGRKKISGATLMPHELVRQIVSLGADAHPDPEKSVKFAALQAFRKKLAETQLRVVEAQWKTLIERLRESGAMGNSLAICDVSDSMGWFGFSESCYKQHIHPIFPAVSLSLVLAQLAKPPFNNGFITFSSRPEFVRLDPSQSLYDTVLEMNRAKWEMNTDLNAVFLDLLLPLAIKNQVKQEDMIKQLFIFSDMQFDEGRGTSSSPDNWTTNHDVIEQAYQAAGYQMPHIVYWNLSDHANVPVTGERKGVALMNGFSPSLLKVFMGESELEESEWEVVGDSGKSQTVSGKVEFNPVNVMKKALQKKSFDGLVIID